MIRILPSILGTVTAVGIVLAISNPRGLSADAAAALRGGLCCGDGDCEVLYSPCPTTAGCTGQFGTIAPSPSGLDEILTHKPCGASCATNGDRTDGQTECQSELGGGGDLPT
jgi:hypothetical protein